MTDDQEVDLVQEENTLREAEHNIAQATNKYVDAVGTIRNISEGKTFEQMTAAPGGNMEKQAGDQLSDRVAKAQEVIIS